MKFLTLLFFVTFNAHAVQLSLDCLDANGVKVGTVHTPQFTYASLDLKADFEHNGELVSIDAPFTQSSDISGLNIAKTEQFTAVGISETSVFVGDAKMQIDILENGLSILKLFCETTINNPTFPRD